MSDRPDETCAVDGVHVVCRSTCPCTPAVRRAKKRLAAVIAGYLKAKVKDHKEKGDEGDGRST